MNSGQPPQPQPRPLAREVVAQVQPEDSWKINTDESEAVNQNEDATGEDDQQEEHHGYLEDPQHNDNSEKQIAALTQASGVKPPIKCYLCHGDHHIKQCTEYTDYLKWKKSKHSVAVVGKESYA
jgi:hypothetical protein